MSFRVCLMMTLSFALISPTLALGADPEKKCFGSAAEFAQHSNELPPPFNHLPLFLSLKVTGGKAAIEVQIVKEKLEEKLKLFSYVSKVFSTSTEDAYIHEVCFTGSKIDVVLEKNKNHEGSSAIGNYTVVLDGEKVIVNNYAFSKCSEAQFNQIIGHAAKQGEPSSSPASSTEGVN